MTNQPKVVGQPCPTCSTPFIQGQKGAYCKPCYIQWKNGQEGSNTAPRPVQQQTSEDVVGKVRHGVAVAFIAKDPVLTANTVAQMNEWVKYIMIGASPKESTPEEDMNIPF